MKALPILIIIFFILIPISSAAGLALNKLGTKQDHTVVQDIVYKERTITTSVSITESIISGAKKVIGLKEEGSEPVEPVEEIKTEIDVELNGIKVATIPKGSKFEGIEVHNVCLQFQYGTDNWYKCEVSLL
jgi:hypothetical protein